MVRKSYRNAASYKVGNTYRCYTELFLLLEAHFPKKLVTLKFDVPSQQWFKNALTRASGKSADSLDALNCTAVTMYSKIMTNCFLGDILSTTIVSPTCGI